MSSRTDATHEASAGAEPEPRRRRKGPWLFEALASYWLSCILLLDLFLLTLFGTFYQVENGLYDAQKAYFESWIVLQRAGPLTFPLAGGLAAMGLLAVNLVCGGMLRIRKSSATVGILIVHLGIALMLGAALVKMSFSDDGYMKLYHGEQSDEFISHHEWEVAIWEASARSDFNEYLIPGEHFVDLGPGDSRTFEKPGLPFDLVLSSYARNGTPLPKGPQWETPYPVVDGWAVRPDEPHVETERNRATLYCEARDKRSGASSEGILLGLDVPANLAFTFESGEKTWAAVLRHKRFKMPFETRLDVFHMERHPGTRVAAEYRSDITKLEEGTEEKIRIEMNEPLRHAGFVLFQSGWGPQDGTPAPEEMYTVLAIVRNPSDAWPLYSCIMIGVGMILAFGRKLLKYQARVAQERARADGGQA